MLIMIFTWIVAFALFGIFYYREKEFKAENLNSRLQIYNAILNHSLEEGGVDSAKEYINKIMKNETIRFTVFDSAGIVVFDTKGVLPGTDHSDRKEIVETISNGSGFTLNRISVIDNQNYFYSAMKGDKYIVRTSIPHDLTVIKALKGESVYLWTILAISAVLSIIAFFASRQLGANIDKLRTFAIKAENGEHLETSSYDFSNDELGEISNHIINIYNAGQRAAKERDEYYKNLIQQEQEKTRIKHQLTNNINHEIKTPVHAVQGCLETIMLNRDRLTKEQILDFADKSYVQIKRLCALLNDISMITRISAASNQIQKSPMDIVSILNEIKDEMSLLPQEKQMRLNIDVPSTMKIIANKGLVESIFRNLVNNSLAYSGGRDIFISLISETADNYMLSVADNGVGIDEIHFERIFERFYRIDEGRSRKMGGTGLGLSIVKNAVMFHGGDINVRTRNGGGIEFIFTLNKN